MTPAQLATVVQFARNLWRNSVHDREKAAQLACEHHHVDPVWVTPITALMYYTNGKLDIWLTEQLTATETIVKHINKHKDCFQVGDIVAMRMHQGVMYRSNFLSIIDFKKGSPSTDQAERVYATFNYPYGPVDIDNLQLARDAQTTSCPVCGHIGSRVGCQRPDCTD